MLNRVIPVLLYKNEGLYKGIRFRNYKYVGDVMNAIRVFSDKEVDELILFDIDATTKKKEPNIELIQRIAEECYMPFAIGGGISSLEHIKMVLRAGAEKVIINTAAVYNPEFIQNACNTFGSSTIVVSVDYKKNIFGKNIVYTHCGTKKTKYTVEEYIVIIEKMGAGEIIINSIDRDGTGLSIDLNLVYNVANKLSIPLVASGGVGDKSHINELFNKTSASAVAVGSFFIFTGKHRSVLLSYIK